MCYKPLNTVVDCGLQFAEISFGLFSSWPGVPDQCYGHCSITA